MRHTQPFITTLNICVAAILLAAALLAVPTSTVLADHECPPGFNPDTDIVTGLPNCDNGATTTARLTHASSGDGTTTTDGADTEIEPLGWPYVEDKSDTNYDSNIDIRVNANEAEDYAIYCYGSPINYIVVVRTMPAPPTSVAGFPIALVVDASEFFRRN